MSETYNKQTLPVNEKVKPSGLNHSFDVGIAMKCGIEAACLYNHIVYWLVHNKICGINFHEGKTWTYDSYEKMGEYLPYLTARQVRYAMDKLVEGGIIIKNNFNIDKFRKTIWYALIDESPLQNSKKFCDVTNLSDRSAKTDPSMRQNCQIDATKLSDPLYTDTILTDKSNSLKVQTPASPNGAKAPRGGVKSFSQEIQETANQIVECLVDAKPDFAVPKNLTPLMTHLDYMIRLDKRSAQTVIDVIRWALADDFWRCHILKPNVTEYVRKKFDQLESKMRLRPARKFAPSSDDERTLKVAEAMYANAIT